MKRIMFGMVAVMLLVTVPACATAKPILYGHAHNDYRHARPLAEALERGFTSVEADVHVIHGQLLVAHDRHEAENEVGSTARTLQTLYLDPLRRRADAHDGRIYPELRTIYLLIDLKSDPPAPAYAVLLETLKQYKSMLTSWDEDGEHPRAVTVIITGNHTHGMIARDAVRYCASDGTLADLDRKDLPPALCPLISSEWKKSFGWNGVGAMPEGERASLRRIVARAHEQGRLLRFWGGPDNLTTWKELRGAGVDLINTDDLAGLQKFLSK